VSPLRGERRDRATYRILDRLSSGLGDDVFLAHHEIFDGRVVQKTVYMHGLEDALASNEPAFLNRLDHPRIVPVREAQWDPTQDRAITFVMPHLAGGSVHDALLEGYRFSIYRSIAIAIDALDALAYVHREFSALHRDTKPGNVLLDENRHHGYLSDFGSAAVIDDAGGAAAVLGTNVYRPPESRLTGRVTVDADIYGIGMMLFEMLNGRLPWEELDLAAVETRLQEACVPYLTARCSFSRTFQSGSAAASGRRFSGIQRNGAALRRRSSQLCGRCDASTGGTRRATASKECGLARGRHTSVRSNELNTASSRVYWRAGATADASALRPTGANRVGRAGVRRRPTQR
jgi:serine/threonine protein kinase